MSAPSPLAVMRERLLRDKANTFGISPNEGLPHVWAVLMETGYARGSVSLVCVADGSVSLYLPTGGGVIGAGEQPPARAAAEALLKTAEWAREQFSPTSDYSGPTLGTVRFLVLTFDGVVSASATEKSLGEGVGPLSALFFAAQALLSQIRLVSERAGHGA